MRVVAPSAFRRSAAVLAPTRRPVVKWVVSAPVPKTSYSRRNAVRLATGP